jgi:hypothetical protein
MDNRQLAAICPEILTIGWQPGVARKKCTTFSKNRHVTPS